MAVTITQLGSVRAYNRATGKEEEVHQLTMPSYLTSFYRATSFMDRGHFQLLQLQEAVDYLRGYHARLATAPSVKQETWAAKLPSSLAFTEVLEHLQANITKLDELLAEEPAKGPYFLDPEFNPEFTG